MSSFDIYLDAIAMIAPGMEQPQDVQKILQADIFPTFEGSWKVTPTVVSGRALRRLSPQTLLALSVAERIQPALDETAAWVFASAYSEGETLKLILDALCRPDMAVRPLRFQNSVHNAASGQWSIAAQINNPVTSICGGDATATVGLLKAILQARQEQRAVGLIAFDMPLPFPLDTSHRVTMPAGIGIAVSPEKTTQSLARLTVSFSPQDTSKGVTPYARLAQEIGNPVLALLPLIERVLGFGSGSVALDVNGAAKLCLGVELL